MEQDIFSNSIYNCIVLKDPAINFASYDNNSDGIVESNEKYLDNILTEIENETLEIILSERVKPTLLNIVLKVPDLREVELNGATELYTNSIFRAEKFELTCTGATRADMEIDVQVLKTKASGASEVYLRGVAYEHEINAGGGALVIATQLQTTNTLAETMGGAKVKVKTSNKLDISSSGISKVEYVGEPETVTKNISNNEREQERDVVSFNRKKDKRSTYSNLNFGNIRVEVNERKDSTTVVFGRHRFVVDDYGRARYSRIKHSSFNGNWGGIDFGFAGYLTPDYDMDFPKSYDYLDLNFVRSTRFDINILEKNIPFGRGKHFGLITGLGLEWRNYEFDRNITLVGDSSEIKGYYNQGIEVSKNKLTVSYLNIPLILEFQTNRYSHRGSFHISAGIIFGARIGSHTKTVFEEKNKPYVLVDPESGLAEWNATSPDQKKSKDHGSES